MFIGIVSGVIAGLISAVLAWFFSQLINVSVNEDSKYALKQIEIYVSSMCNDLIWGAEDENDKFYADLQVKVGFLFVYIQNMRRSIRKCNLLTKRKMIMKQLYELERFGEDVLGCIFGTDKEKERTNRLKELYAKANCCDKYMIPLRRCEALLYLLDNSVDDAIEKASVADTDKDFEEVKRTLLGDKKG